MIGRKRHKPDAIRRTALVSFTFDGAQLQGHQGETLVAALIRAGHLPLRSSPNAKTPRGAFCCMGLCQECTVLIDGQKVEACRTPLRAGLQVVRA